MPAVSYMPVLCKRRIVSTTIMHMTSVELVLESIDEALLVSAEFYTCQPVTMSSLCVTTAKCRNQGKSRLSTTSGLAQKLGILAPAPTVVKTSN